MSSLPESLINIAREHADELGYSFDERGLAEYHLEHYGYGSINEFDGGFVVTDDLQGKGAVQYLIHREPHTTLSLNAHGEVKAGPLEHHLLEAFTPDELRPLPPQYRLPRLISVFDKDRAHELEEEWYAKRSAL